MSLVQVGDDDDTTGSLVLNWTSGALHCSHAGLTAIPRLPSNALFLYGVYAFLHDMGRYGKNDSYAHREFGHNAIAAISASAFANITGALTL